MKLRRLVPMAEVASVPPSIELYGRLGFAAPDTFPPEGEAEPTWASLHHGGAERMLARAEAERSAAERVGRVVPCGEIATPFYAPRGELERRDPDGYLLVVTHT